MNNSHSNNTGLMWVIGIISLIAIVLAWMAFNRSGTDVSTVVEREAGELEQETEDNLDALGNEIVTTTTNTWDAGAEALARADARANLAALQVEFEVEEDYDAALAGIQGVRADLRATYNQAEGAVQRNWQALDQELERAEQSIRTESADALEIVGGAILLLEDDVRTEDQ
jgi:hypothetical protein